MKSFFCFLSLVCALSYSTSGAAQSLYYVERVNPGSFTLQYGLGVIDLENCTDSSIIAPLNISGVFNQITDIAYCPNGDLYFCGGRLSNTVIAKLNVSDSTLVPVVALPNSTYVSVSLVCDKEGILYAGREIIWSYNTNTDEVKIHGSVQGSLAGDLTFINGELYGTEIFNNLLKFSILPDTMLVETVYAYPLTSGAAYGITTIPVHCDSNRIILSVIEDIPSITDLYSIDPFQQTMNVVCSGLNKFLLGATAREEFIASDCRVNIDLDDDNSSGPPGKDYAAVFCTSGGLSGPAADTSDAVFYSGYPVDSLVLRLLPALPDGASEYLTMQAPGLLGLDGQATQALRLTPVAASALPLTPLNGAYQTALRSLRYHNDAPTPTLGPRTVEVVAYALGGRSDMAYAYIELAAPVWVNQTETLCAGQSYMWQGAALSADTSFCVTLSNALGCDSTYCLELTFLYPEVSLDTVLCAGQTLLWQGLQYAAPGTYQDTLLLNGCQVAATIQLQITPPDTLALSATICAGASYVLHGQTFTASGVYAVGFTDPQGCEAASLLNLTVAEALVQTLSAAICPGETYDFYGQTLNTAGNYVFADTTGTCDTLRALALALLPAPQLQISGPAAVCDGETGVLSVTGGPFAQVAWSGGQTGVSVSVPGGAYAVTVTNAEGCTATAAYALESLTAPAAEWTTQAPRCAGERNGALGVGHASGGLPPYAYVLNTGVVSLDGMFAGLGAGTYTVTMQDAAGCESVFELTLSDPPALSVVVEAPPLLPPGGSYRLMPQITPAGVQLTYAWSPQEGLSCADCPDPTARPTEPTTYTLTVTDANGCRATASVWVNVLPPDPDLYAPSAFMPQSLLGNEGFTLFGDLKVFVRIELLQGYDRWGNLLWEGRDLGVGAPNEGWDGRSRGRLMQPGGYVWYAEARRADGELVRRSGDVTLLR